VFAALNAPYAIITGLVGCVERSEYAPLICLAAGSPERDSATQQKFALDGPVFAFLRLRENWFE